MNVTRVSELAGCSAIIVCLINGLRPIDLAKPLAVGEINSGGYCHARIYTGGRPTVARKTMYTHYAELQYPAEVKESDSLFTKMVQEIIGGSQIFRWRAFLLSVS